eukprot:1141220-Ditylum_brightwellii.AAC.1
MTKSSSQDNRIKLGIKDSIKLGSDDKIEFCIKDDIELGSDDGIKDGIKLDPDEDNEQLR